MYASFWVIEDLMALAAQVGGPTRRRGTCTTSARAWTSCGQSCLIVYYLLEPQAKYKNLKGKQSLWLDDRESEI